MKNTPKKSVRGKLRGGIRIQEIKKALKPRFHGLFTFHLMADREGFEPSVRVNVHTLSRRAPSTSSDTCPLTALAIYYYFIVGTVNNYIDKPPSCQSPNLKIHHAVNGSLFIYQNRLQGNAQI